MTNFQVYKKTLSFSFLQFVFGMISLGGLIGCCVGGFYIAEGMASSKGLIGLAVGLVIGIIIAILINYLILNRIKAAQIAMMTKGVTEGELPDHVTHAGFEEIKGRFGKITVFFFVTGAIKGVFRQIGRSINRIGTAVGGEVGNGITSAIDSAIQTLIDYLCDCCLGWVLYRKDMNSAAAACEGAVIFFKHGKTLIRNVGRIFGMGLLSLVLFGGAFFGIIYVTLLQFPQMFDALIAEITTAAAESGSQVSEIVTNPTTFVIFVSALSAVIIWSILHSVIVRPFILVGVLRNFMEAGKAHMPTEADLEELERTSPKFAKLRKNNI